MTDHLDWGRADGAILLRPHGHPDGPRLGQVSWLRPGVEVRAEIEEVQGSIRVTHFDVQADLGVPSAIRRLPSDTMVMAALRGLGPEGSRLVAYLLDDLAAVSAERERVALPGEPPTKSEIEEAFGRYMDVINRRPRARVHKQVEDVRRMIDDGKRTSQIVELLVTTSGISEATAYRRIKEARRDE